MISIKYNIKIIDRKFFWKIRPTVTLLSLVYLSAKKYKSALVPPSKKSLTLGSMRTLLYIYYFFTNRRR